MSMWPPVPTGSNSTDNTARIRSRSAVVGRSPSIAAIRTCALPAILAHFTCRQYASAETSRARIDTTSAASATGSR
jgi:hypothetical protein